MSQFSNYLKLLITQSQKTPYSISKYTSLDRTTLQRTIKGERLPSWSFVEQLANYLNVSSLEFEHLSELYEIEKIGSVAYFSRSKVKSFLEHLSEIHQVALFSPTILEALPQAQENIFNKPTEYTVGSLQVSSLLKSCVYNALSENTTLYIFLPLSYRMLFDEIQKVFLQQNPALHIKHLVLLDNGQDSYEVNFDVLSNVLPFSFSSFGDYDIKYCYENLNVYPPESMYFPYYIISDNVLICISADYRECIYYTSADLIDLYRNKFLATYNLANRFSENMCVSSANLQSTISILSSFQAPDFSIEAQPCFAAYFTPELIAKHLRPEVEHYETMIEYLKELYLPYQGNDANSISFFTQYGLKNFMETGVCINLPPMYATPFSLVERKALLLCIVDSIKNSTQSKYKMINNAKFYYHPTFSIDFSKDHGLLLLTATNENILTSFIDNNSLCEYIYNFMNYLYSSDLLFTDEEAIKYIMNLIEE